MADASQHQADVGSETFERERNFSLIDKFRDGLREVEEALARLAGGVYGYCARCAERIDPDRLEALPAAPYCNAYEDRYETAGALEERPPQPTVGVAADEVEFLPDDEFEPPPSRAGEGPEQDAVATYVAVRLSAAELEDELAVEGALEDELAEGLIEGGPDEDDVDELLDVATAEAEDARLEEVGEEEEEPEAGGEVEADLFTPIRRQLGDEEEPDLEGEFEPDGEAWSRRSRPTSSSAPPASSSSCAHSSPIWSVCDASTV